MRVRPFRMAKQLGWCLATVFALGGCGPSAHHAPTTLHGERGQCSVFELDVRREWTVSTSSQVRAGFLNAGVSYGEKGAEMVSTSMDDLTRDWVMLAEQTCNDLQQGRTTVTVYNAKITCFQSAALQVRALAMVLTRSPNAQAIANANDAVVEVQRTVGQCLSTSVQVAMRHDLEQSTTAAAMQVGERLAQASIYRALGNRDSAEQTAAEAQRLAQENQNRRQVAQAALERGRNAIERDKYREARQNLDEAERGFQSVNDEIGLGLALREQSRLAQREGRLADALRHAERAVEMHERLLGPNDATTAMDRNILGVALMVQDRFSEAIVQLKRSVEIIEHGYGIESTQLVDPLINLGVTYIRAANSDEAESIERRALAIVEKNMGTEHPRAATARVNIASVLIQSGRSSDALTEARTALGIADKAFGSGHTLTGIAHGNIAAALTATGKEEEALAERRLELDSYRSANGEDQIDTAGAHRGICNSLRRLRRFEEAQTECQRALSTLRGIVGEEHSQLESVYIALAQLAMDQSHNDEALPFLRRALEISEHTRPNTTVVANNRARLARLLRQMGRTEEALAVESGAATPSQTN